MTGLELADLQVGLWNLLAPWATAAAFPVLFALVCFCLYAEGDAEDLHG